MTDPRPHNAYVPGYKPAHIKNHTWRTAENSAPHLIPVLQSKAQTNPNTKLLDCGAGPGSISVSLAKYIPQGEVTATDLSEEVIQRAATLAETEGVTNVKVQAASIYELPFEDDSFDVVHAHQVLCHLDQPLEALRSMLRVCKPGGVVALREVDMRMWSFWPESEPLKQFHKLITLVMGANGGYPNIGPRLVSLAMQAGIPRERVQASMGTWCYSTREEREVWGGTMRDRVQAGEMRKVALERGLGWGEEDMDKMAQAWDEWIEAEDGCFGCLHGEVLITK
ncbi:hypothetical protein M409DRAFT_54823 [Zasmidium cellare ATCC 36951]|uniref:Methyltransferase domain-containing protein n=1 Tax=Zasmidium cellare ATCC 36951 TaxID=1080233 RepID=A0A6A6CJZ7_ZASCE|nr:uncharacterized protein M409DRAFT_54823 [Zasmidium cellare ATCC 36951]KAF2166480.1 hypothetical protein M409DRAFT_54823 [Zasmidium cellare ATCC 36951]